MFDDSDLRLIPGIESIEASFNPSDSGFKQVYACTVNGKKNAVKVTKVADRSGLDEGRINRLRRELELLSALSSPYLPKLGDLPVQQYRKSDSAFIVYSEEFIEGEDVSELVEQDFFADPTKVTQLIHDVCSAIKIYWSHERTVHRDVKPANIRYSTTTNKFILIDAGIALVRDRTTITPSGHGSPRTPCYAAPEVIRNERNISYRTDLFCLGIVAYEAALRQHPFMRQNMSRQQIEDAILTVDPANISDQRQDLPAPVSSIIMKMLRKRPHQRPISLDDIIDIGSAT